MLSRRTVLDFHHRHTILLVEDDPDARSAVAELLRLDGYEVREAGEGQEALDVLRTTGRRPCVVLLDLKMPGTSGWCFRALQLRDRRIAGHPGGRAVGPWWPRAAGASDEAGRLAREAPRFRQASGDRGQDLPGRRLMTDLGLSQLDLLASSTVTEVLSGLRLHLLEQPARRDRFRYGSPAKCNRVWNSPAATRSS
jgi:response regulator receiver domain-containing protein